MYTAQRVKGLLDGPRNHCSDQGGRVRQGKHPSDTNPSGHRCRTWLVLPDNLDQHSITFSIIKEVSDSLQWPVVEEVPLLHLLGSGSGGSNGTGTDTDVCDGTDTGTEDGQLPIRWGSKTTHFVGKRLEPGRPGRIVPPLSFSSGHPWSGDLDIGSGSA